MRCDCTASHRMVHGAIHSQTVCVGRRNCALNARQRRRSEEAEEEKMGKKN